MCTSNSHSKTDEQNNQKGITLTDADGNKYFVLGKNKIKITEHFTNNGKSIDELVTDLIEAKIKENITNTA